MTPRPIVFVVDADVSVRESLERLIDRSGWQPQTFASAPEFLAQSRVPAPSCMVLDVALPGLSGLHLQKLVADRTDMPIIFLTGSGDVAMIVQAMKAGAVEFLTKPFRPDVLVGAIREALERSWRAMARGFRRLRASVGLRRSSTSSACSRTLMASSIRAIDVS